MFRAYLVDDDDDDYDADVGRCFYMRRKYNGKVATCLSANPSVVSTAQNARLSSVCCVLLIW